MMSPLLCVLPRTKCNLLNHNRSPALGRRWFIAVAPEPRVPDLAWRERALAVFYASSLTQTSIRVSFAGPGECRFQKREGGGS